LSIPSIPSIRKKFHLTPTRVMGYTCKCLAGVWNAVRRSREKSNEKSFVVIVVRPVLGRRSRRPRRPRMVVLDFKRLDALVADSGFPGVDNHYEKKKI